MKELRIYSWHNSIRIRQALPDNSFNLINILTASLFVVSSKIVRQPFVESALRYQKINFLTTPALFKRVVLLLFLLFPVSCSLSAASHAETPKRIISLAPSVTEILFAAGLGDNVVGVTTFCDYPPEAKTKAKIGGMSNPSLEAVVSLKPELVVLTTDGNPEEFAYKLRSMKIKIYVFDAYTLPELPDAIRRMGMAIDAQKQFDALAAGIEQSLDTFQRKKIAQGKKILFIIWPEPLIVAGPRTAADDAMKLLGGINIAGKAKGRYPKYSMEEVIRQSPDVIIIGKGLGMEEVSGGLLERLSSVPAVKNKKVFYVSDSLYRLGPRAIKGIEELEGYLDK